MSDSSTIDPERHRRLIRSARGALWGSLLVTATLAGVLYLTLAQRVQIEVDDTDYSEIQEVVDLQGLVRIDTTADRGSEIEAARYLEELLARGGIEAQIEDLGDGHANLLAIVPGLSDELLVLHSHLDTDPIRYPERWVEEPFGGMLKGPYIYGRGVFDMKSVTIAQVHAMLAAARRAREQGPARLSLALLATSSEETDSLLGARHVLASRPELVERFWVVLSEGGVVEMPDDEIKHWGTSFAQKRYVPVDYHGPVEALEEFRRQLLEGELGRRLGDPVLVPEVEVFVESYLGTRQDPAIREPLRDLPALLADPELFESQPNFLKALFRAEVHPLRVTPAEADGEVGGTLRVYVTLPLGADADRTIAELLPSPEETPQLARTVDLELAGADAASPIDHPAFRAIQEEIQVHHGDVPRGPFFLALYVNDCRYFRQTGTPCYGFSPFALPGSDSASLGGPDERMWLRGYVDGVALYVDLVERLLALPVRAYP